MSPAEKQQLKVLFVTTALYFGQEIADDVLLMYVADLADLPFKQVEQSIGQLRRDPKITRCPLPSQIRAKITPESNPDGEALMVVGRITEAMSRLGPYRVSEAKAFIGPVGWEVCKMDGGWEQVCSIESEALYAHKAQWRNLAKALIERGVNAAYPVGIEHVADKQDPRLTSLASVLKRLPIKEGA